MIVTGRADISVILQGVVFQCLRAFEILYHPEFHAFFNDLKTFVDVVSAVTVGPEIHPLRVYAQACDQQARSKQIFFHCQSSIAFESNITA